MLVILCCVWIILTSFSFFSISISESRFKVWKRTALAQCIPSFDVCKIMGHKAKTLSWSKELLHFAGFCLFLIQIPWSPPRLFWFLCQCLEWQQTLSQSTFCFHTAVWGEVKTNSSSFRTLTLLQLQLQHGDKQIFSHVSELLNVL